MQIITVIGGFIASNERGFPYVSIKIQRRRIARVKSDGGARRLNECIAERVDSKEYRKIDNCSID